MRADVAGCCWLLLLTGCAVSMMWSQTAQQRALVINGHAAKTGIMVIQGKTYVDLDILVRLTHGSVSYQGNDVVLTLPQLAATNVAQEATQYEPPSPALSREFMKAGIEEINQLKEWASSVANAIRHGYPIAENWVSTYQSNATNGLHLASVAASTPADRDAYQLLADEFETVNDWSNKLVEARKSMNAAHYATSPSALEADPLSQKITKCAHFLASMLASGSYQDDPSCH